MNKSGTNSPKNRKKPTAINYVISKDNKNKDRNKLMDNDENLNNHIDNIINNNQKEKELNEYSVQFPLFTSNDTNKMGVQKNKEISYVNPYKITMKYLRQKAYKKTYEEFFPDDIKIDGNNNIDDFNKKREII